MSSVLRSVRKRKTGRTLGPVDIIRREASADLEVDVKVARIRSLVPLGLMRVEELLDAEVRALAGARYARPAAAGAGMAATPGRSGWPAHACRFAGRGFGLSRGASFRGGPTRRGRVSARSTTGG